MEKEERSIFAFPTDDEYQFTVIKPIPDPTMGPFVPHLKFKRAK
jgi:hypothetical protein